MIMIDVFDSIRIDLITNSAVSPPENRRVIIEFPSAGKE